MSKKHKTLASTRSGQGEVIDPNNESCRRIAHRKSFVTLGGCSTYEVGQRMSTGQFLLRGHLWRRPTIALIADPIDKVGSRFSELPAKFLPYFFSDAKKLHLTELLEMDAETLIFDITRDLTTGVVDLGENQFVLDPLDGVGIVEGLSVETMNGEIFAEVFKNGERVSYYRDWRRFFQLWKHAFTRMIEEISTKFTDIILLEHYFTAKVNGTPYTYDSAPRDVELANIAFEQMYAFARRFPQISIVSLPRHFYATGRDVAWGGPLKSHYLTEVYLLYAEKTTRLIFPECEDGGAAIVNHLFERAAEREQMQLERQALIAERDQRAAEGAAFRDERDAVSRERDAARAEHDRIAGEATAFCAERDQAFRERDEARARLDEVVAHNQGLAAERDRIAAEAAAFCVERDQAFRERDEACARLDEVVAHNQGLAAERDRIAGEAAAFCAERDQAFRERDEARVRLDEVVAHSQELAAERDRLAADMAQLGEAA